MFEVLGDGEAPSWWGGRGRHQDRLSVLGLVKNETLDLDTAALLWLLVEHKCSVIVAAVPQLAGKTTLLSAVMDLAPPRYSLVYTRGRSEDFAFLDHTSPDSTYIMVSELSNHLPSYMWGRNVRTLFDALDTGYSLAATIHSGSPEQVLALLASEPVGIPRDLLANVGVVVNISMDYGDRGIIRRVDRVTLVRSPQDLCTLYEAGAAGSASPPASSPEAARALGDRLRLADVDLPGELSKRREVLESWMSQGDIEVEAVQRKATAFYAAL